MRATSIFFSVATLMLLAGCGDDNTAPGGSGFVEADEVTVSAETAGRVLRQLFSEGAQIDAGDTLALIDASRVELEIASAEANRQTLQASRTAAELAVSKARQTEGFAKSERDRVARLLRSGSATQKQLDQLEHELAMATNARQTASANVSVIEAQLSKLDADIARLQRQLQDAFIISPASGIVTEEFVDAGEVVAPGKAIARVSQLDTVWVKVYLPAAQFASVKIGDKARISTESGTSSYEGTVSWTSEQAEFTPKNVQTEKSRTNLVYAIKVTIPNADGRLKIGMPVFVTLERS